MNRALKGISIGVTALVLGGASLAIAQSGTQPSKPRGSEPRQSEERRDVARAPKVMVVAMHADWCGKCKVLGPKLMNDVAPATGHDGALFVKVDQTSKDSAQAEYLMAALGLGDLWGEHGGKTGYALLVDAQSKRVISTLRADQSAEAMTDEIESAIRKR